MDKSKLIISVNVQKIKRISQIMCFSFFSVYGMISFHKLKEISDMPKQKGKKEIAANRKAYHDYFILERFEAGIVLAGTEVKSVRNGQLNLKDSFCTVKDGELWARGIHISPYEKGNIFNKDPVRPRKLLMHKREITKLNARVMQDGNALIPLSFYFKDGLVKVEIGLCKGKKIHDKRDSIAERESKREVERTIKERNIYS